MPAKQLMKGKRQHPFTIIPNELITAALTKDAKIMYLALAMHADNETGQSFPSYDLLVSETGLQRRNIVKAIHELVDARWVDRRRRFSASTVYILALEQPFPISSTVDTNAPISITVATNESTSISSPVDTTISSNGATAISSTCATLTRPNKLDPTSIPSIRPRDLLFDAVAEVTASNVKLQGSRIAKVANDLRKIGATPDQVKQVAEWYLKNDWRGRKGDKLTFASLIDVWESGIKNIPAAGILVSNYPRRTSRRPQVPDSTEEQRERAREEARKRIEERARRKAGEA